MTSQHLIAGLERRLHQRQQAHTRAWRLLKDAQRWRYPLDMFERTERDAFARLDECRRLLNWIKRKRAA